jgi:hypothetical protein
MFAKNAGCAIVTIEIVCSDKIEHRRRVESRDADIKGHALLTWDEVQRREYESWDSDRLVIDTAQVSAFDAAQLVFDSIKLQSIGR